MKIQRPGDEELIKEIKELVIENMVEYRDNIYETYKLDRKQPGKKPAYHISFLPYTIIVCGCNPSLIYEVDIEDSKSWANVDYNKQNFEYFSSKIKSTLPQYDPDLSKAAFLEVCEDLSKEQIDELCFEDELDFQEACELHGLEWDDMAPVTNWRSNHSARVAFYLLSHLFETLRGES